MLLELSEILACPACGPPQVMVAVVHAAEGRRVWEGFLGCPSCEARFPITDGVPRLVVDEVATPVPDGIVPDVGADTPLLLAALLGLDEGRGPILLGHGLSGAAEGLAKLAPSLEVIELVWPSTAGAEIRPGTAISRLAVAPGVLPFQSGRLWGIGLAGSSGTKLIADSARLLVPGGRVVALRPPGGASGVAERAGLEVLAADERALVAALPARRP